MIGTQLKKLQDQLSNKKNYMITWSIVQIKNNSLSAYLKFHK